MRIVIVEDEVHIARHLSQIVLKILDETDSVPHICVSLRDALEYLSKHTIDLLFLDLNLKGKDGFDTLKLLVSKPFHVIVVSAHIEKAIEAFEYGVLDFIPKPFTEIRIRKALDRLEGIDTRVAPSIMKNFVVKKRNRRAIIKEEDILFFEAYGHYSKIHVRDGSIEVYDKPLITLESLLDDRYDRVHKSFIVKMTEIREIKVFANGSIVKISREKYKALKAAWRI